MKKTEFIKTIDQAIVSGQHFHVVIQAPDLPSPEVIINPPENLRTKKGYYMNAYDEDMKLKVNNNIRITGVRCSK